MEENITIQLTQKDHSTSIKKSILGKMRKTCHSDIAKRGE